MALVEVGDSVLLDPKPGFVVKTRVLESKTGSGSKVFINICHDDQVPSPEIDFEPNVVFPLIIENQWEIPIIVSREKETVDKKGVVSKLYDCCINSKCFQWCQLNADLRTIMIEWSIEAVELLYELTLEREYSIPKMLCKGELSRTEIRKEDLQGGMKKRLEEIGGNETLGLLEELDHDSSDSESQLPSLMNLSGDEHPRPLIEELSDMRIGETPSATPKSTPKSGDDSMKRLTSSNHPEPFPYEFNFVKSDQYSLVARFVSALKVAVSYDSNEHSLVFSHNYSTYRFSEKSPRQLVVPLPITVSVEKRNVSAFHVSKEKTLYIFCR